MKRRRSPVSITLVLIGSAALYGCAEDDAGRRDVYRSRADCQADWGSDVNRCETVRSGEHSGYYYGPTYYGSRPAMSGGSSSRAVSTTPVQRGGLGSTASVHGSSAT